MPRTRDLIINAGLVVGSVLFCLLIGELVVFRFLILPSDVPADDFVSPVVRYVGDQTGVWRVRNEIAARYAINAQGWNSGVGDYVEEKRAGVARVAVVGDSFVEGFTVDHRRSLGERLSQDLSGGGSPTEAYRFGVSGAPFSQYVYMTEREVARYRPDWIVVLLVHNDFDESFRYVAGRYTSSFLKLQVEGGRVVGEIPPTPRRAGVAEWLRRTATARCLYYRWQVRPDTLRSLFIAPARAADPPFAANIDVGAVSRQMADIAVATDYLVGRLKAAAAAMGARLALVMDADRSAVYSGATDSFPLALARTAGDAARRQGVLFLDLQAAFAADWAANRARFEFLSDGHWNEHGHAVAARAVAAAIRAAQAAQ